MIIYRVNRFSETGEKMKCLKLYTFMFKTAIPIPRCLHYDLQENDILE